MRVKALKRRKAKGERQKAEEGAGHKSQGGSQETKTFCLAPCALCHILFEVQDTGIGIAAEKIEQIFSPFTQLAEHAQKSEGTGLGLAISQRLVQLMGGEQIRVKSIPGQGSTFWFELPFTEAAHADQDQPTQLRKITGFKGTCTLLLVDDHAENRAVLRDMLEPVGFTIREAADGHGAISEAEQSHPALILMDLMMTEMDGFEAARRIRAHPDFKDTIIVAVSASVFQQTRQKSQRVGCHDFLTKPVQVDELFACLQKHLALEWIYDQQDQGLKPLETSLDALIFPPRQILEELRQFAEMRSITDINRLLEEIKHHDTSLQPFAATVQDFAQKYQFTKVLELLASALAPKQ